jgi:hypothetical protein
MLTINCPLGLVLFSTAGPADMGTSAWLVSAAFNGSTALPALGAMAYSRNLTAADGSTLHQWNLTVPRSALSKVMSVWAVRVGPDGALCLTSSC